MTSNEVIFGLSLALIGCITIIVMYFMSSIFELKRKKLEIEEMKTKKELGIPEKSYKLNDICANGLWVTETKTTYGDNDDERQTSSETKASA